MMGPTNVKLHARDHFVEDQHGPVLGRTFAQALEKTISGLFILHGLQDDTGNLSWVR